MRKKLLAAVTALVILAGSMAACGKEAAPPGMRAFPHPYRSMLALCSDIDETTPREFEDYHTFLNTLDMSEMGEGLGLDVADSFWMYMANDGDAVTDRDGHGHEAVMTWFQGVSKTRKNADLIAYYFKRGWIDCIHSYGDFSREDTRDVVFTRALGLRAANELTGRGVRPVVWINHGNEANTQNLEAGNRKTYRQGARPGADGYHADATVPVGVKFVWFSDNDRKFGRRDILYPVTLADGQKVWGFRRYTSKWSVYEMEHQLTDAHLDACVKDGRPVIVAQHLGGTAEYQPLPETAREALRNLAARQEQGEILVTRTSRLLEYVRVRDHLVFEVSGSAVNILAVDDPQLGTDENPSLDTLRGMTFYVADPDAAGISVGGEPIPEELLVKAVDETGQPTVGVAWFEPDTTNYTWNARGLTH